MPIDLSQVTAILRDIGVSLTASAIYDFLKSKFQGDQQIERAVVERELDAYLKIHGVKAEAATVINALVESVNSGMSQNADGSIGFMVGNSPDSSMKFFVGNARPTSKK